MFLRKHYYVLKKLQYVLLRRIGQFFELSHIEHAPKFFARVEARQNACDLVAAHIVRGFDAFRSGLQPKIAEIAQFDDVALCQLTRDNGQEGFDSRHNVGGTQGGHLGGLFCQLTQGHASAGLNGWVELFGGFTISRVAALNHIEFDTHDLTPIVLCVLFQQDTGYHTEDLPILL